MKAENKVSELTMRDYIAIQAMKGVIPEMFKRKNKVLNYLDKTSEFAYEQADSMIEESNK